MRRYLFYAAFIAFASLVSCNLEGERVDGNGNLKTENRHVSNTTRIMVVGGLDVFVDQGPSGIRVEGDENILRFVETNADNEWLEIKTRDHVNIHSTHPVKIYVTTPEINAIKVSGSGNITCNNKFSSDNNIAFSITGSGNINANVNSPAINASISGSGNMYIKGETRNADIHITGSGNYDSPDLKAENASVSISGSGDASLFAENNLKASIVGSGGIKYRGNAVVEKHITGSGAVMKMQ